MQPVKDNARILTAAMVGTAIEYYDFFIYATAAALFFGPQFFPAQDPAAQTLLSFMTLSVAFIARPIGALAFGHFGDRVGRKSTLVASLLLMGISTLLIAFLPTYAMVGWVAPALLCLLRFGQGFGLGGEWAGAALLAVENAPKGWEARFGAAPQMGVAVGFLTANGTFLLLSMGMSDEALREWGWRVPFLVSAVLVALGLWVRLKISETPVFKAAMERGPPVAVPFTYLLGKYWPAVLAGSAGGIACYAVFYLGTTFALSETTGALGYDRQTILILQLIANLFLALSIAASAIYADRTSPRTSIAVGALASLVVGMVFMTGLNSGSLITIALTLIAVMSAQGFVCAAQGRWLSQLFPVGLRYSGVAFTFNIGGILGGGIVPIAAQMLSKAGSGHLVSLLFAGVAGITLLGVWLGKPLLNRDSTP